ncbi:MAG: ATP-binding protein [Actinomycetota bacterium]|nr:ATP-binding protein [Actinomycetota bacterium]
MSAPAPTISPELRALLRRVKLGQALDTLPERLALAKARSLGHAELLELVLSDEVTRRDTTSADLRARRAGLDPTMRLENWDDTAEVTYDRATLDELVSLRFVGAAHNALILGPVGVGKTFIATALGHAAVRRRVSVHFERADQLFKRLKASRLDLSHDVEIRKLIRCDLLVVDDLCLHALDAADTADLYELIVERHGRAATIATSNREPIKAHRFARTCARWRLNDTGSPRLECVLGLGGRVRAGGAQKGSGGSRQVSPVMGLLRSHR